MADLLSEAQKRYQECLDALSEQRRQIEEDLAFSDPSNPRQWDEAEERQRLNDPGGARPCLVMDQTSQYVQNVAGQVEQRPPALHAIPVDSGADRKVAEQLDGFFRHIEHASRAQQHYARALTSAARAGVGYIIVRPEVIDRPLNYQEPRISSEGDPLRVVIDPWSQQLDGSDADCGWLLTPMSHNAFERQFGTKAEKVSFGDESRTAVDDQRESILVAEQWIVENDTKTMVIFRTPEGDEAALTAEEFKAAKGRGEPLEYLRDYKDKYRCVKWCRLSGSEILTKETAYPASGIGIVPVYGYVGWTEGRMTYCGIPRRAREPQRAYNYHISEIRAYMNLAPKAPWIASKRAIKGLEPLWDMAAAQSRAYLPFNDLDEEGAIAAPQRMPVATNLSNHSQGAEQALRDIQAAIGMYQANLGAPSNETSGVAIESRKQQGEASTANFPANLAASLTQVGRLVMDMIPRLIDTPRQLRILGHDMAPSQVRMDPSQGPAVVERPEGGISINPNVGRYDVRVVVGPSFSTQRTQTNEALNEVMARNPALMPAIAPLWAKSLDFAEADKLAQVLTAMAPDPVKAILSPEGEQESVGALKAERDQLAQRLQELAQLAQEAQQDADEAQAQLQAKAAESDAREDEVAIKSYDAFTKRLDMLIKAVGPTAAPALAMAALPAETPEGVRVMLAQTIGAAMAQPQPTDDAGAAPMEPEMPQEPQGPSPEMQALEQVAAGQEQLMQGLGQLAQTMGQLVKLVQAKRIRTPEYRNGDPNERVARVVDEIDPETFREMPAEGSVQ